MCDNFGQSKIRRLDIEITLYNLKVWRYTTEKVVRFFVSEIA